VTGQRRAAGRSITQREAREIALDGARRIEQARTDAAEGEFQRLEALHRDFPADQVILATTATVEPQTLILDGFPSPYLVAKLGPNSGTINRYGLGRLRKDVQGWVKVAVLRQGIRPVPPPVRVTLRYVFPDARHRDADNFAVIGKPVVDGLVRSGILAGDNAARLTQRIEFVKEAGGRRLEVLIEALEG
jgi:hypothetical protein